MPHKTIIRLSGVARNPANGFPARLLGVMLLKDVRGVFQDRKIDRMASADLVQALLKIEESPWGDLSGKPLDAGRLAKLLKPFGIGPKQLRLGPDNKKGYEPKFFEDSWDRYIPVLGETPETPKQMASNEPGEGVLVVSAKSLLPETTPQGETKFEPEKANVSAVSPVSAFQGLEVWPESHWPGFALRQTDVL